MYKFGALGTSSRNAGIDRYYLIGKDADGENISIDSVFDRSEAAIRLNFNKECQASYSCIANC
jgi:hypothetical protein